DGRRLVIHDDQTLQLLDMDTGKCIRELATTRRTQFTDFSDHGDRLAIVADGKVLLWKASTGEAMHTLNEADIGRTHFLHLSPDGKRLVTIGSEHADDEPAPPLAGANFETNPFG